MTKDEWKIKIEEATQAAGTYRPFFDAVIDTLAGILERRDLALETFEKTGGNVIVKHTNKGGSTNLEQNPALRMVNDLNRDALAYWRDLGLTPSGLKKINEKSLIIKEKKGLADVLDNLGI